MCIKPLVAAVVLVSGGWVLGSTDTVWVGGPSGSWEINSNWSSGGIPHNGMPTAAYLWHVHIDNGAAGAKTVTMGTWHPISHLTVSTGDGLIVNNIGLSVVGESGSASLTNQGTITLNSVNNWADLYFPTATTLSGSGRLVMQGPYARILDGGTLNQAVGHTITGAGSLGYGQLTINNAGLILSDTSGTTIDIDARNNGSTIEFTNTGTVKADHGGVIRFLGDYGGRFSNVGGTISAMNASGVQLHGWANIAGGTYTTQGTGTVGPAPGQGAVMSDYVLSGTVLVPDASILNLAGTITNHGTHRLVSGNNWSTINVDGSLSLAGTGAIRFEGTGYGRIIGSGTLTLGSGQTLSGHGSLGAGAITIVNHGVIEAAGASESVGIDARNNGSVAEFTNHGTIQARNGGYVAITGAYGGAYDNRGVIRADGANSRVVFDSWADVRNGTFATSAGGTVQVAAGHGTSLTDVTNTGLFLIPDAAQVNIGNALTNTGTIQLTSGNSYATLSIGGVTNLGGTGTVRLDGTGYARIMGTGHLTIGPTQRIAGFGSVAYGQLTVTNNGTIDADQPGQSLAVDPFNSGADYTFTNNNLLRASNGGILNLAGDYGGRIQNTSTGLILATGTGSTVNLYSSIAVRDGTLRTQSGGIFNVLSSHSARLIDLTVDGNLSVHNNGQLELQGTILNNGLIRVISGQSWTNVSIDNNVTLNGTGTLRFDGDGYGRLLSGGTLVNNSNIRGYGYLGFGQTLITNNGLIEADAGNNLVIDAQNNGSVLTFENNATLRASAGSMLTLTGSYGGAYRNGAAGTGRMVARGTDSLLRLVEHASITGGEVASELDGLVYVEAGNVAYLTDLRLAGSVRVLDNATLNLYGTIRNDSTLTLASGGSWTSLGIPGTVNLTGTGRVQLGADAGFYQRIHGGGHLINQSTLSGAGYIAFGATTVTNMGLIDANTGGMELVIDARNNGSVDEFVNHGTLRARNGGTMTLMGDYGGRYFNDGVIDVQADSTFRLFGSAVLNSTTSISGSGMLLVDNYSDLTVRAIRTDSLQVLGRAHARIASGGGDAGTSLVNHVLLDTGTTYGQLDIADHAMLVNYTDAADVEAMRAHLRLGYNNDAWNGWGMVSSVARDLPGWGVGMTTPTLAGMVLPAAFGGMLIPDATTMLLVATYYGDANLDGAVGFTDLLKLAQNYDQPGIWGQGDFNHDGIVNFPDLLALAQNYGQGDVVADWATARALVPEPAMIGVIVLAGLALRPPR
jgi:hypothetical protein